MDITEVKNLSRSSKGIVDCELNHPHLGWIPFTAHPEDMEESTVALFAYLETNNITVDSLPLNTSNTLLLDATERGWRDAELGLADVELLKAEDADPSSVGTPTAWREYRIALRAWPESADFPNATKRPIRPGS